ncbi:MAG: ABC transporter substrate-binding protein [Aquificaceae bacterium]|nr:ABC transporter substrate-binding protein [Aquificaceae bacterium]
MRSILTFLTLFLLLIGGSSGKDKTIKLGVSDWPGWVAWYIAQGKGFFKEEGLDVKLVWFNTYSDSLAAFATGQIDANSQTLSDTLPMVDKGVKVKVILVNDNSAGNDAVVGGMGIDGVRALKGKKIAAEVGSISHFFLLYTLEVNGLSERDVTIINMTTQDAGVALMERKVDAAALWEPWVSRVAESGRGRVLFSSKEAPGLIPDLLVVREQSLKDKEGEYIKLVRAWFKVTNFIQKNPGESSEIIGKVLGIKKAEVLKMLGGIKFFGQKENLVSLGKENRKDPLSLYVSGERVNKYLIRFKFIKKEVDLDSIIYDKVVKNAAK